MSESTKRPLFLQHPRRVDVPVMLLAAAGLLIAAYILPTLKLTQIIFFTDEYSIWRGIVELWKSDHFILAGIILTFSMVFPITKLLGLAGVWLLPLDAERRRRLVWWIAHLGKWSMVDVFVVAILVMLIKAKDVADAEPRIGIYLFAAAVVVSMVATNIVESLARKADGSDHSAGCAIQS